MHCYRVYTPLWLWYWPWVHNVLQQIAWGKKIPARRYTHTARRSEDKGDVWVSRSLKGYSQDAGCENWEPRRRRLARRPCGKPEGLVTESVAEDTCETWDCTLRSVAGYVTSRGQIAGRRRWSRYGESPRRRNVRDGRCEGDGAGLPRRDLRAVAVPGEFCVIKSRLRANLKLCRVIPQHINKPVTGGHAPPPPENFGFLGVCWCILGQNRPTCVYAIWSSKLAMQNKVKCYITCELLCGYLQQLLTQIDSVRDNCTFIKKSWFVYSDNVITRLILQVTHHVHALLFILSNYGG